MKHIETAVTKRLEVAASSFGAKKQAKTKAEFVSLWNKHLARLKADLPKILNPVLGDKQAQKFTSAYILAANNLKKDLYEEYQYGGSKATRIVYYPKMSAFAEPTTHNDSIDSHVGYIAQDALKACGKSITEKVTAWLKDKGIRKADLFYSYRLLE